MNAATIIILLLLAAAVWVAVRKVRNGRCSSCEGCSCPCEKRSE